MKTNQIVRFRDWVCRPVWTEYANGRMALRLVDAETGEPIATASVNVPEEPLAEDEICIKTWSENEGMEESLVAANIIKPAHRYIKLGWVTGYICRLTGGTLA